VVPESELPPEIRKTGHRMADMAVAFSALFVSLCSLGIALHHGRTMQRLVEANSRPFIQFVFRVGDYAVGNSATQALTLMISNPGAGAARIERFSVLLDGRAVDNAGDALMHLAGLNSSEALGSMSYSDAAPSYVKAGSDELVLRWPRTEKNAAAWDRVSAAGPDRLSFEACYCSIFDECWIEKSAVFRPTPVKSCA
jgi:hypothetical protein